MTESYHKVSGRLDVAQSLNTSILSNRLRRVLGVSRTENSETVLSAEVGCPGIIDTGASKSVIGQRKVKKLIASLPANVQSRVQWGKSDTVFRFGNNATLSSVGALYIPFGGCWMRLEVVSGDTPFLLSNAFLKATSADVSSRNSELVFHQQGCKVPLQVNAKGLFTVELSEVLKVFAKSDGKRQVAGSCEVVTYVSNEMNMKNTCNTNMSAAADEINVSTAAEVAHHRAQQFAQDCSRNVHHGVLQGHPFPDGGIIEVAHGQRASDTGGWKSELCQPSSSSDAPTSRDLYSQSMGRANVPGGKVCRRDFSEGLRQGREVQDVYDESLSLDVSQGSELPELHQSDANGRKPRPSDALAEDKGQSVTAHGHEYTAMASRGVRCGMGAHGS